jgi:hypothetical protein
MSILTLTESMPTTGLEVNTGMPLYVLLPLILVIGIAVVVGVRWLFKKTSK